MKGRNILKIDSGEYFYLGKGGLEDVFDTVVDYTKPFLLRDLFSAPYKLHEAFDEHVKENPSQWGYESTKDKELYVYFCKLSGVLWEWAEWDRLIILDDEELGEPGILRHIREKFKAHVVDKFRQTGSRYEQDWPS